MKNRLFKRVAALGLATVMAFSTAYVSPITVKADDSGIEAVLGEQATVTDNDSEAMLLKKGRTVTYTHSAYTLTIKVLKVETDKNNGDTFYTLSASLQDNGGTDHGLWLEGYGWRKPTFEYETLFMGSDRYTQEFTVSDTQHDKIASGWNALYVSFRVGDDGDKVVKHYMEFQQPAPAAKINAGFESAGGYTVTKDSITLGKAYSSKEQGVTESGTAVKYRVKGSNGEYETKTFKAGQTMKLTGLKEATCYEVLISNYIKNYDINGNGPYGTGGAADGAYINTASTKKPAIASIKVSGVKQYQVNIPGEWKKVGNKDVWVKPHKEWRTKMKCKVTLKEKPKALGKLTFGLVAVDVKKTFTYTAVLNGKKAGTKYRAFVIGYANTNESGQTPTAEMNIKVKNGTYK